MRTIHKLIAAGAALALTAVFVAPSLALSIDPNRNVNARELSTQQVNYYRFTINWNDANIASGVAFGALKEGTFVTGVACHVTTAFNAGSTNVVTVGTTTTATEIIDAATSNRSIDESSATYQNMSASAALGVGVTSAADVTLYAKYAQTGTPASAGSVTCIISFIPDNDM